MKVCKSCILHQTATVLNSMVSHNTCALPYMPLQEELNITQLFVQHHLALYTARIANTGKPVGSTSGAVVQAVTAERDRSF